MVLEKELREREKTTQGGCAS